MTESKQAPQEIASQQAFLETVETLVKDRGDIGVAADFDENISRPGPSNGLDPRDSRIDPGIAQSIRETLDSGRDVVIVSSRGARDVARIADSEGISIVGTLGWETLDKEGNSRIHPQFRPFRSQITGILRDVRERFFTEQLQRDTAFSAEPNAALAAPDGGVIILQSKGYNTEYPEGINATWSLNMVSEQARQAYTQALQQYYQEAFATYAKDLSAEEREKLAEFCSIMPRAGHTAEGVATLDIEIRPVAQGAKALAVAELMKKPDDPTRLEHFSDMPSHKQWIFSGDHIEQDIPVMQLDGVLGVWSRSPHDTDKAVPEGVDIVVDNVSGNAALMKEVAAVFTKYPASASA